MSGRFAIIDLPAGARNGRVVSIDPPGFSRRDRVVEEVVGERARYVS